MTDYADRLAEMDEGGHARRAARAGGGVSTITIALLDLQVALGVIEDEYEEYGGWPGEDDEAKVAAHLANQLLSMSFAVALGGREYAEGGPNPFTIDTKDDPIP